MPKMILKQESRLNGVKTNIFNLDEVAKSLRVPEEGTYLLFDSTLGISCNKVLVCWARHKQGEDHDSQGTTQLWFTS